MAKKTAAAVTVAPESSPTETTATTDPTAASKTRKPVDPDAIILWTPERDSAIVREIMAAGSGKLTASALAEKLAASPSFDGEAHLLSKDGALEKVRAHVKRLSKISQQKFGIPLDLRRATNRGTSAEDTLASVFAELGYGTSQQVQSPQPAATATSMPTIPVAAAPTTIPVGAPVQFVGGLIPTP